MRHVGFSTGALAKGDFRRAIRLQADHVEIDAIELSALRDHELRPLIEALPTLALPEFEYISFHAPSKLGTLSESEVVARLREVPRAWPIVVHPEIITTPAKWHAFGPQLCLENMDNRKPAGRTVAEMRELFALFPEASFCLDIGHARQIDPTMALAFMMLTEFSDRLVQIHVSDVGPKGEHLPVRQLAEMAFRRLAHRVPAGCALIIESVVSPPEISRELSTVRRMFDARDAQRAIA